MPEILTPTAPGRTTRLTVLVSGNEAVRITGQAEAVGMSVSAYLRDRALGTENDSEATALHQFDALVLRMESDLDAATAALTNTLARLDVE